MIFLVWCIVSLFVYVICFILWHGSAICSVAVSVIKLQSAQLNDFQKLSIVSICVEAIYSTFFQYHLDYLAISLFVLNF